MLWRAWQYRSDAPGAYYGFYNADPNKAQLRGLVSGILGAAQYERQAGVPGMASEKMWDILGWGLSTVILLLIGGNVFYGLAGLMRRQKR